MEIWKSIEGYEGVYEISNLGRVKSFYSNKEKIIKHRIRGGGYFVVVLTKNQVHKQKMTHRLIAKAFVSNPENKSCVNHKDGIKTNNNISNLEWCTVSENTKHAYDTGLFVNPRRKIIIDLQTGIFYDSIGQAAKAKNITRMNLSKYLIGYKKNKTSFDYA